MTVPRVPMRTSTWTRERRPNRRAVSHHRRCTTAAPRGAAGAGSAARIGGRPAAAAAAGSAAGRATATGARPRWDARGGSAPCWSWTGWRTSWSGRRGARRLRCPGVVQRGALGRRPQTPRRDRPRESSSGWTDTPSRRTRPTTPFAAPSVLVKKSNQAYVVTRPRRQSLDAGVSRSVSRLSFFLNTALTSSGSTGTGRAMHTFFPTPAHSTCTYRADTVVDVAG